MVHGLGVGMGVAVVLAVEEEEAWAGPWVVVEEVVAVVAVVVSIEMACIDMREGVLGSAVRVAWQGIEEATVA